MAQLAQDTSGRGGRFESGASSTGPRASEPRRVTVVMTLFNVSKVVPKESLVELTMKASLYWVEPSLVGVRPGPVPEGAAQGLWKPDFEINNGVALNASEEPPLVWNASGLVRMAIRFSGTVFNPMDVRDFPFDRHRVCIHAGPVYSRASALELWTAPHVVEVAGDRLGGELGGCFIMTDAVSSGLPGWKMHYAGCGEGASCVSSTLGSNSFSRVRMAFDIERCPRYFIARVVRPTIFLQLCALMVFVLPAESVSDRTSIALTIFLTSIALQFLVKDEVPASAKLTCLDTFMLRVDILNLTEVIGMGCVGLFATRWPSKSAPSTELASRLDMCLLGALVVAFALTVALFFARGVPTTLRCWEASDGEDDFEPLVNT